MAKATPLQTNFTSGELSPRLYGHVDLAKYKNGLRQARNAFVQSHGPVRRRNGFEYINETKTSSSTSRLIRFQFDQDNAYILEFGLNYIRFYTDGGVILSGGNPYEVTTTYTAAEVQDITYVQFGRILYLFHGSHAPAQLVWTSDASWVLSDVDFYPPSFVEDGEKPNMTLTPAATSGASVNFTVSSSYFLAGDVGRQLINLSGAGTAIIKSVTTAFVAVCTIIDNFPSTSAIAANNWKIDLSPLSTLTPSTSRIGSLCTLTSDISIWKSTGIDVGKYVSIHNGIVKIISITSSTVAVGEVQKSLNALTATSDWFYGTDSWTSTNGYPTVGALHQQRLWAGGVNTNPVTIYASESGLQDAFGAGTSDSDALEFDLSGKEISKVSWMGNIRGQLVIGTTGSEITVDSGGGGPITPTAIDPQPRGSRGSNLQQPVSLDNEVLYVQRSGQKLNTIRYNFEIDNYESKDLLFFAEHLTNNTTIKEVAYAQDPDRSIFAVLNDGSMLVSTYLREEEVVAWTKWTTDGSFESVNTISTGENDEVWVIVKRTINGSTKRYVERLDTSSGEDNLDGFSDCYLTYSNPKTIVSITKANPGVVTATSHGYSNGDRVKIVGGDMTEVIGRTFLVANKTSDTFQLTDIDSNNVNTTSYTTYVSGGEVHKLVNTISGLSHLEAKTVQIKVDGAVHDDKTVSGGSITLDSYGYEVVVGLGYTTTIETLPKEFQIDIGSSQGQQTRPVRPVLRFYKSSIPEVNGEFVPARSPTDLMDSALGLFTGDIKYGALTWKDGYDSTLTIEISRPLPMVLLGIFGSVEGGSQ